MAKVCNIEKKELSKRELGAYMHLKNVFDDKAWKCGIGWNWVVSAIRDEGSYIEFKLICNNSEWDALHRLEDALGTGWEMWDQHHLVYEYE